MKKVESKMIIIALTVILLLGVVWPYLQSPKMNLPGTDYASPYCPINPDDCRLLIDSTTFDPQAQQRVVDQQIFDEILTMVDAAETFIVADFFLLNPWKGSVPENHRALSSELAARLIAKKQTDPAVKILLLTDPFNRIYGEDEPAFYGDMVAAGISIVFTDVDRLPPSNSIYSPLASAYIPLLAKLPPAHDRIVPNPFDADGKKISAIQLLRLLHFRANHRKLIVTDDAAGELHLLTTSFNPADGSAAHSNVGVKTSGPVARHALAAELDCIEWSAAKPSRRLLPSQRALADAIDHCRRFVEIEQELQPAADQPRAQWLTERAIRRKLLKMLQQSGPGDNVDIAIFYFSDRALVRAVSAAARRGVRVRIIMDANKDAFGREKNGIPNRIVAAELMRGENADRRPEIRWALTHGEQFHSKAIAVYNQSSGKAQFLCGSANWTRRNIQNLNLEACIYIENAPGLVQSHADYFDQSWNNTGKGLATTDYDKYAESGWSLFWKTALYRFQERSGASTF